MTDSNVSSDLLWQIVSKQSSYIVKKSIGGNTIVFSRDPLNLRNVHSRKVEMELPDYESILMGDHSMLEPSMTRY